jgi:ATP-binding cassette subfamily F protein uup
VSHDRFFVDKIAKKLFIIQEDRTIEESFQDYSEYLDYEKEMKALSEMEQEFARSVKKVFTPEDALQAIELATSKEPKPKQKIVKLSYEEKKSLETLPKEIESLEEKIESLQNCLADPKCYEDKGLTAIAKEQEEMEVLYEQKVEQLLEIEEKVELIANQ